MTLFAVVAAAWSFGALPVSAQKPAPPPAPAKAAKALRDYDAAAASWWLDCAAFAADRGAKAAAAGALDAAAPTTPAEAKRAASLRKRVDALRTDAAPPDVAAKVRATAVRAAAAADRLLDVEADGADEEALEARFFAAAERTPGDAARQAALRRAAAAAAKKPGAARAARLLARATGYDAEGRAAGAYAAAEDAVARADCLPIKAPDHEMRAFVALPADWRPDRTWPVLVAVEGAGSAFQGACRNFRAARKDLPFIVVVPVTLSNTNALSRAAYPDYAPETLAGRAEQGSRFAWDEAGLLAVLRVVRDRWKGEARHYMTGFSGGGLLTYWWLLRRPDDLRGAVAAGANFHAALAPEERAAGARAPVLLLLGEKDEHREKVLGKYVPGLDGQLAAAEAALRAHGYEDLRRTLLPGVGHSPCASEVVAFCDALRRR